jgi:hypothetical protein
MYSEGSVSMQNLLHKHVHDSVLLSASHSSDYFLEEKQYVITKQYVGSHIMSQQKGSVNIELHILHFGNDYN